MQVETILGRHNPFLTHLRKLASSRAYRVSSGEYLCEGTKMLEEALRWHAPICSIAYAQSVTLPPVPEGIRVVCMPDELLQSVSTMQAPQGVSFTVELPQNELPRILDGKHYLVLDGLQDPGNVGTILRTADAFSCDGVFLLNDCADVYAPKTARATMGAIFRQKINFCSVNDLTNLLQRSRIPLYATALREDTVQITKLDLSAAAVAIGSEGKGLSREVLDRAEQTILIPMSERCESLNAGVAASIVLWEMYRR